MSLPPSEIPSGAMRFNSDSQKLEYYDGAQWLQVSTFSPNLNGGARGITGGAYNDGATNVLNYITISTTGNAVDFGDTLTAATSTGQGCASSTRGVWAGGLTPTRNNVIQYVTISSTGNALDFGDLTAVTDKPTQCSNSTRGINVLGSAGPTNTIQYVTIQSTGNAIDFGDLLQPRNGQGGAASSTRAVFAGGYNGDATARTDDIYYVNITTTGNALTFGELTPTGTNQTSGCSDSHGGLG